MEGSNPDYAGLIHKLAQSKGRVRAYAQSLLARDGFLPELDGTQWEAESEPPEARFEGR